MHAPRHTLPVMRAARARLVSLALSAAWLSACSPGDEHSAAERSPGFVAARVAELETAVSRDASPAASDVDVSASLRAGVERIAVTSGEVRSALLEEIAALGDAAVPRLVALIADASTDDVLLAAALDALAAVDTPHASNVLAGFVESSPRAFLRARAAFELGRMRHDHVVVRLLARIPHETDAEAAIWIANTLGRFGNWAGVDGLLALARRGHAGARERLDELARDAGFDDPEALARAWKRGDPDRRLRDVAPSTRLRLEVWRAIAALASDDARVARTAHCALGHSSAWVTEPLCQALADADARIRTGVANALRDMGPRARTAGVALMRALDDADTRAAVLEALGAIGHPPALARIVQELRRRESDALVRASAARALGSLALPAAIPPLTSAIEAHEPREVRHAAALALAALDRARDAAPVLAEALTDDDVDAAAAEAALESWLASEAATDGNLRALLALWKSLDEPPGIRPGAESVAKRRAERAALVRRALGSGH